MKNAKCTWNLVEDVDGYNVYLKSNSEFVKQNTELITDLEYIIEDIADGEYEAYATSVRDEIESEPSNIELFEVGDSQLIEAELFTLDDEGTAQSGNTFYIDTGENDILITAMDFIFQSGDDELVIYYKTGDHTYSINDYTQIHESEVISGNDNAQVDQRVDIPVEFLLEKNTRHAIFVVRKSGSTNMGYTNGSMVKNGDGDITYVSDRGVDSANFGSSFEDRQWNGRILYKY